MTLYEMLSKTVYYQPVWIFECNKYDQNMPMFKGSVEEARADTDNVWPCLMQEVDHYICENGILDIRVKSEDYDEAFDQYGPKPLSSGTIMTQRRQGMAAPTPEDAGGPVITLTWDDLTTKAKLRLLGEHGEAPFESITVGPLKGD